MSKECPIALICSKRDLELKGVVCPVRKALDTGEMTDEAIKFMRREVNEYVIFSNDKYGN